LIAPRCLVGSEDLVFGPGGVVYRLGDYQHAAFAPTGSLYLVDRNEPCVRVIATDGTETTTFGGDALVPHDVLVHRDQVYVSDTLRHHVRLFDPAGNPLARLGPIHAPRGIVATADGDVHVVAGGDSTVHVLGEDGTSRRVYGGYGEWPGRMLSPRSIACATDGQIYVSDPPAGLVHAFEDDGTFVGRFRPRNEAGEPVVPVRITALAEGGLYVWTAGQRPHPIS